MVQSTESTRPARIRFDARDEKVARLLTEIGMTRPLARTILALASGAEATSAQLEAATDLRQPEVSAATMILRERGWAEKREIKREGKGRPLHVYRLTVTLEHVATAIEAEREREMAAQAESLRALRALVQ